MKLILSFLFAFLFLTASAQSTHRQYLSGEGLNHTVTWDFYCSDGNNSQRWSKIEVPSQWELQGFGTYTYGRWYKEKGVKNPVWKPEFTGIRSRCRKRIRIIRYGLSLTG